MLFAGMRRVRRSLVVGAMLGAVVGVLAGCQRSQPTDHAATPAMTPEGAASVAIAVGAGRRTPELAKTHESIEIPAGRFYAGSFPGDEGRDPTLEPVTASYQLPSFSIDALPYPNEPDAPPLRSVTSIEAGQLCAARNERLCTELEWERACRGPNGDAFSSGPAWDPSCAEGDKCVSGFGVRRLAGTLEEWTASTIDAGKTGARVVVKGAYATASPAAHRCASRHAVDPYGGNKSIGFRCCSGGAPQQAPKVASIEAQPTFRKATFEPSKLADAFAQIPELARLRNMPRSFKETDLATVFESSKSAPDGATVTIDPILWSPVPGEEILVLTGKSKGGAYVVALHVLPGDRYRLASSMIFANEQGPIALAYQPGTKKEIQWSMCWGCAGEGGAVTYRDDHRVVIVQR